MTPPPASGPEAEARVEIDAAFIAAGWVVQNREAMNLSAGVGVAVREFKLKRGHGYADYLLFVNGKAVGVLEAKQAGNTLSGVEPQLNKYALDLIDALFLIERALPSQHNLGIAAALSSEPGDDEKPCSPPGRLRDVPHLALARS